jgi:IS30 family transposase
VSYKRNQKRKPLSDLQKIAARGFFEGKSVQQIAAECGVHRCTIWRWRKRKDFQREINRVHDLWVREYKRQRQKEWHSSPEYKRRQRQKYNARRRLKRLERKISEAGNAGDMAAYWKYSKEYDQTFNIAFFGGLSATDFLKKKDNPSRKLARCRKQPEPLKYIIEFV